MDSSCCSGSLSSTTGAAHPAKSSKNAIDRILSCVNKVVAVSFWVIPYEKGFVRIGSALIPDERIQSVDLSALDDSQLTVSLDNGIQYTVYGHDAFDFVMRTRPESMEGKRLRFARHAWAVHNLVAHPALQVLHWLGLTKLGLWVHDITVPRPKGVR